MKQLWLVLFLAVLHTLPLWNLKENLAGGAGDPFAHAAIGEWYCKNVVTGNFQSDIYMFPFGVNMSGNYDSPFPFFATCPFVAAGPLFQFHLFTLMQIALILFSAWLVARSFLKNRAFQFCYILFVWWCGFYIVRSHQHITLLSLIWGFQFVIYAIETFQPSQLKKTIISSVLIALAMGGTFYNIATLAFWVLILGAYKLWSLRKDIKQTEWLHIFVGVCSFSAIFALLWGPMIFFNLANGTPVVDYQRKAYNLDLMSPFLPYVNNFIYKVWDSAIKIGFERYNPFDLVMFFVVLFAFIKGSLWRNPWQRLILILSVFYFILALGPELRLNDSVISQLDLNGLLLDTFPFRLSRTPARFAALTNLGFIFLGFVFLDQLRTEKLKKYIAFFLLAWIIITGPLLNQMWFFPTFNYAKVIPAEGLNSLNRLPENANVVSIPAAWAQDPTQNFNRLFHKKNITSAYLSYPSYTRQLVITTSLDPFLGKMGCEGDLIAFARTDLFEDPMKLQKYLVERNLRGFVINKDLLVGQDKCRHLAKWVVEFLKYPWVKVTQENGSFVTAEIL